MVHKALKRDFEVHFGHFSGFYFTDPWSNMTLRISNSKLLPEKVARGAKKAALHHIYSLFKPYLISHYIGHIIPNLLLTFFRDSVHIIHIHLIKIGKKTEEKKLERMSDQLS